MKQTLAFVVGAAVIIGITFGALSLSANNKFMICHVTGNGSAHVIDIDEHALPAHLAHGDSMEAAATWLGLKPGDACVIQGVVK